MKNNYLSNTQLNYAWAAELGAKEVAAVGSCSLLLELVTTAKLDTEQDTSKVFPPVLVSVTPKA